MLILFIALISSASQWQNGAIYDPAQTDCDKAVLTIHALYPRADVSCDANAKLSANIPQLSDAQLTVKMNQVKNKFPNAF